MFSGSVAVALIVILEIGKILFKLANALHRICYKKNILWNKYK